MHYFDRLHYDQETGALTWAVRAPGVRIGELAGGEIDHINGDKLDDRLSNLRVVDRFGNAQNMPSSAQANNHSCGLRGVTWNKQHRRWQSKLMANKVVYHVGYFRTPEEAHEAYMRLKARLHLGGRSH